MSTILLVVCGAALVLGGIIGLLLADRRTRPRLEQQRDELQRAERSAAELQTQLSTSRGQNDQLSAELEQAATHAQQLEDDLASAKTALTDSTRRASERHAQLEQLQQREAANESALSEARAGLRKVLEQDKLKGDQLARLREELQLTQQVAQRLRDQAEDQQPLRAERDRLAREKESAVDALAARDVEMTRLHAETERLRQELEQAAQAAESARDAATPQPPAGAGGDTLRVIDVLDTDPDLHVGAREAIRMLYERFTKNKGRR